MYPLNCMFCGVIGSSCEEWMIAMEWYWMVVQKRCTCMWHLGSGPSLWHRDVVSMCLKFITLCLIAMVLTTQWQELISDDACSKLPFTSSCNWSSTKCRRMGTVVQQVQKDIWDMMISILNEIDRSVQRWWDDLLDLLVPLGETNYQGWNFLPNLHGSFSLVEQ